jgi:hypothetical protein
MRVPKISGLYLLRNPDDITMLPEERAAESTNTRVITYLTINKDINFYSV